MCRVVVDTNVFISSRLSLLGNPAKVMNLIADGEMELYYSLDILDEYVRVLAYKRLNFSVEHQKTAIEDIKSIGILINPSKSNIELPDKSDIIFYDAAKAAGAYLITGNLKHYPSEAHIISPAQFIEMYGG